MYKEFFRFYSTITSDRLINSLSDSAYYYFLDLLYEDFIRSYKKETNVCIRDYSIEEFEIDLKQGWFEYDPVTFEWIVWVEER